MEDLTYQHLDEIVIASGEPAIVVQYSEADQGGTRLLYRFSLPRTRDVTPMLRSGYAHYVSLRERQIGWGELPPRVAQDLLPWLAQRRQEAQAAGKPALDRFLGEVELVLRAPSR